MEKYVDQIITLAVSYGPNLILAILTLIIGFWVIRIVVRSVNRVMEARNVDDSLRPFLKSMMSMLLKAMLVISVAGMIGIEMTSFIAVLGAAGLAVGMALSGTLQNFAGGVMILLFKPFKVGDFIEAQGYAGSVKEIQIFNTILKTGDNKTIIIPNGGLSTSSMINYSTEPQRRVDLTFGIAYENDFEKAISLIQQLVDKDERILSEPEPWIRVTSLADSSVNITARVWCESGDYWGIYIDLQESVKKAFDKEGISIPYPQLQIHNA